MQKWFIVATQATDAVGDHIFVKLMYSESRALALEEIYDGLFKDSPIEKGCFNHQIIAVHEVSREIIRNMWETSQEPE